MDKNNKEELYRNSSDTIKELYSSENTGEILMNVANKFSLNEPSLYKIFALSVGDIILGMYKKESLNQILKDRLKIDNDKANLVILELKELMDKIPESDSASDFVSVPQPVLAPVPPTPTTIAAQPTIVKPMRTFPDDFNAGRAHSYGAFRPEGEDNDPEEPTHSSSQDDVLRK